MTRRARIGILGVLLLLLTAVALRLWAVRATSPERVAAALTLALGPELALYHRIRVGATRLGLSGGSLIVTDLSLQPDSATMARLEREGAQPPVRYQVTVPRIEITGIGRLAALRGQVDLGAVIVHQPEFQTWRDRTIPRRGPRDTVMLPHQRLRRMERGGAFGSIEVRDGLLRYHERAGDGARFAELTFDSLQARIGRVQFPEPGTPSTVPIEWTTLVYGQGRLDVQMEYDLATPGLTMAVAGTLSRTDPAIFNEVLVDLEGVRITQGTVDTIRWNFSVAEDVAQGTLLVIYRNLRIDKLDKVTRRQDLGDEIMSFIGNQFALRTANPRSEGEPAEPTGLWHKRPWHEPLFKFLWVTLRGGLLKTVGI